MSERRNIFGALEDDWAGMGRRPAARAALLRWSKKTPALAGLGDPFTVVERCHSRDQDTRELLAAVLCECRDDRWAQRTVLQVVLPGLRAIARRASCYIGGPRPVWQSQADLDQDVVRIALDRIRALAGAGHPYPCRAIVDGTWQRLRHQAQTARREADRLVELDLAGESGTPSGGTCLEDLASMLIAAVEHRMLDRFDAGLVYSCHVLGFRIEELASLTRRSERTLWRRRRNAERRLASFASAGLDGVREDASSPTAETASQCHGRDSPAARRHALAHHLDDRRLQGTANECGSDRSQFHPYQEDQPVPRS